MSTRKPVTCLLWLVAALTLAACGQATPTEAPPEPTESPQSEPTDEPAPTGPQEFALTKLTTTSLDVIGVGSYAAAQPFALAGEEGPEAVVLPYSIAPNDGVDDPAAFEGPPALQEDYTFTWSLVAPEASSAALLESGAVAYWLADVPGAYALTLEAQDAEGNSGTATWTVTASTYVGVGGLVGDAPTPPQCASCHAGKAVEWGETAHALLFEFGANGGEGDHYSASCIYCHTTGFNNWPEAVNGGFDDLAAGSDWLFPDTSQTGGYDAMVVEYPEITAMTGIQCESCHGPGAAHYTADVEAVGPIGVSLEVGTCAQCHNRGSHHKNPRQWVLSGHGEATSMAFTYGHVVGNTECAPCHSGEALIDMAKGLDEIRAGYQPVSCAVCHDPHSEENPAQVRVYDDALISLPDGTEITGAGASALCMSCHQSRTAAVGEVEGEGDLGLPHYSTAAELLNDTGGYTWGEIVENSAHSALVEDTCVACHMAASPGMNDMGTPDNSDDDEPLPGHLTVGEHTFAMVSPVDGAENIGACIGCHTKAQSLDWIAKDDYDGDGALESCSEEIEGLRDLLYEAMIAQGVVDLGHHPYFELPEEASLDLRGAVFNYKFTGSGGSAVHNFKRTLGLLQLSLEKLGQ